MANRGGRRSCERDDVAVGFLDRQSKYLKDVPTKYPLLPRSFGFEVDANHALRVRSTRRPDPRVFKRYRELPVSIYSFIPSPRYLCEYTGLTDCISLSVAYLGCQQVWTALAVPFTVYVVFVVD